MKSLIEFGKTLFLFFFFFLSLAIAKYCIGLRNFKWRRVKEETKIRSNRGMTGIEFGEKRDLGWMSNRETTRLVKFSNVDVTWIFN